MIFQHTESTKPLSKNVLDGIKLTLFRR